MSGDFVRRALRCVCALAAAWLPATVLSAPPPATLFTPEPEFDVATISPRGTRLVRTGMYQGRRTLLGMDIDKKQLRPLLAVDSDDYDISWCRFKNEDWLVCSLRMTEFQEGRPHSITRIVSIEYDHPKAHVLIRKPNVVDSQFQDEIIDWLPNDPTHVLIELAEDGSIYPSVFSLDIQNGRQTRVLHAREPILGWMTDGYGVVRFGAGHDGRQRLTYIARDREGDPWRDLVKAEAFDAPFEALGFGPTPDTLLISAEHNGRDAIFELDLKDSADLQLVFSHPSVDVGGALRWPSDHRITGFWFDTERPQVDLFDSNAKLAQRILDQTLPGAVNTVVAVSADGKRLLAASLTDTKPATYHLLDRDSRVLLKLGSAYPALDGLQGATMRPVQFTADKGLTLPGYVTVPVGSDGKHLPTVVLPHGGPYSRDEWGYDVLLQFLVSRGYAVVQVNYRGSTGYGTEWFQAGLRNWGTVMVDDITAAARWSIDQGIADPARMCIVGWSYGGYAALMSAVREPKLYRCAVSIAGVSDLRALVLQDSRFFGGRAAAEYTIGDDREELAAGSPLRAAGRIEVPVMLVHGTADIQVVVDHSRKMAQALERAGKQPELIVIDDGDHSLRRPAWRLILFEKLEKFLGENLPAVAQGTPP